MTLDEAIKALEESDSLSTTYHTSMYDTAVQLGIEALKRLEWLRSRQVIFCDKPLEGETE